MNEFEGGDMKIIDANEIEKLNIAPRLFYKWIEEIHKENSQIINPTKTRIPLNRCDYFNVMPCIMPGFGVGG